MSEIEKATEARRLYGLLQPYFPPFSAGTWTPAWSGTLTLGAYTYVAQQGFYTRIADIVHVYGRIAISAIGTAPTGVMVIFNLPFTCSATAGKRGAVMFGYVSNLNLTAAAYLTGLIETNESQIRLEENFDNAASGGLPAANFNNAGCDITFFGSYPV